LIIPLTFDATRSDSVGAALLLAAALPAFFAFAMSVSSYERANLLHVSSSGEGRRSGFLGGCVPFSGTPRDLTFRA
jgi:hypothetical protein